MKDNGLGNVRFSPAGECECEDRLLQRGKSSPSCEFGAKYFVEEYRTFDRDIIDRDDREYDCWGCRISLV